MAERNEKKFGTNQLIFREGESGQEMYILIEGAVELRKKVEGAEKLLKTVDSPNDFFGEMSLIDNRPRSATAVAVSETRVIAVNEAAFENLILTNGRFALKIIKALSERIRASNTQISELVESDARERFVWGLVEVAVASGDKVYGGGRKVQLAAVRDAMNKRLGFSPRDFEALLDRLIKSSQIQYVPGSDRSELLLSGQFIERNDRRNPTTSRSAADRPR